MESADKISKVLSLFGRFADLPLPAAGKLRPRHQVLEQFVKLGGVQLLREMHQLLT
jgi:hypothetical protein